MSVRFRKYFSLNPLKREEPAWGQDTQDFNTVDAASLIRNSTNNCVGFVHMFNGGTFRGSPP